MIDPRVLRDDPDRVRAAQAQRGLSDDVVDRALSADTARRQAIADFEGKRAEQKAMGKQVAQAQGEEKQALLDQVKQLAADVKTAEAAQAAAEEEWTEALKAIPNIADPDAPAGGEDDYTVLEHVGTPREFDFTPRDHVELGRLLGAFDLERGAKTSGSRFYYLTGVGAQLELALVGHPRHHPRAPVRQGGDVRLHHRRGVVRRAPAPAGVGEGVPRQARAGSTASSTSPPATSADRPRASSTARRGSRRRAATAS